MVIDRKEIKRSARKSIAARGRGRIAAVTIVFLALLLLLNFLTLKVTNSYESNKIVYEHTMAYFSGEETPGEYEKAIASIATPSTVATLLSMVLYLTQSVLTVGYVGYTLNIARDKRVGVRNLFDSFYIFFKVIGLNIMMAIFVWLWSCLFVIPGIIAALRYSQATLIMMDDPKKSIFQCINESKQMMVGHIGQYAVLLLSMIGWYIITWLATDAVSTIITHFAGGIELTEYGLMIYAAAAVIFVIAYLFIHPYMSVTRANFYRCLKGEMGMPGENSGPSQGDLDPWKR